MSAPSVEVDLHWKECTAAGCSGAGLGATGACLTHLDDREQAEYLQGFSRGRALDARGVVVEAQLLERILGAAPVDELGRRRMAQVRLDGALLRSPRFDGVVFGGDACFDGAELSGLVSFRKSRFEGSARFAGARFGGHPDFEGAVFGAGAWFAGASFAGDVSFQEVAFGGPVRFDEVVFAAGASFQHTMFQGHASFRDAGFASHADFTGTTFEDDPDFLRSTFARRPSFHQVTFRGRQGAPEVASGAELEWAGPPLASWSSRACAAALDHAVPVGLLLGAWVISEGLRRIQHNALASALLVAGGLASIGFMWANLVIQGRMGQSLGKRRLGLRLVGLGDRRPVGAATCVGRQLLHLVLDTFPLLAGWLWPLHDSRRQTFADKVVGTVVISAGENWHRSNRAEPTPLPATGGSGCC